jgi:ATP/maltotriose-dependent transcriptional regulator MalT
MANLWLEAWDGPYAWVSLGEEENDLRQFINYLLAQRLSSKEIAEKLFISTTTVKGHLQNIYGKLNVSKRREAVEKTRALGILRPRKG